VDYALKVLIVGGTAVLTYAFLLGFAMARERMRAPQAPRHLVNTHLEALMQGAILLGLVLALEFSTLPNKWESVAAWLLVGGSVLSLVGSTLNWLQAVGDPFAEKPPGFLLQSVAGPVLSVGIVIVLVGVLKGL
jgi:hypothetical protein